ncbi:MFS transporter [Methylobacterium oxalidis]|uniref:MFS transporter n=1 Tax=Methylobacterium oxalidis TaxID=944322 RepID=A0A512J020_9HYPH|nr:MFS transporter [Methylobacterium oxalidis]GEP03306.1 MFS transporter [Methylobacterium oxalidis]GJE30401.1 putative 3-phenylpropionic acid transporter [Methylobacterium oxalidis]GLS64188.1 MFS transporter [Methylobacterium oxalidis]
MRRRGRARAGTGGSLPRFLALYGLLYAAYGSLSPILPNFLESRGLSAREIAAVLAGALLVRLVAGPLAGRLADRRGTGRGILAAAAALSGLAAFAHLPAHGFPVLLAVGLVYALATAPLAPLADALALLAAQDGRRFQYGWVRGAGAAAFIGAASLAGWLIGGSGLGAAVSAGGILFLAAALAAGLVPPGEPAEAGAKEGLWQGFATLLRSGPYRRILLVAALVVGAHAMHDAFTMILWREAGIGAGLAGLLWSEAVAAEVLVFLLVGAPLVRRLGPGSCLALAAAAGALRWAVTAETAALPAIAGIQILHGLTFALLHLACLDLIERNVAPGLRATALTLYGSLGVGLATALLTLASGSLYATFGQRAFWAMAALSLLALPISLSLRAQR